MGKQIEKILEGGVEGWMDDVDFQYELGYADGGNSVFPSEENLRKYKKCIGTSEYCVPAKVIVFDVPQLIDELKKLIQDIEGGKIEEEH